MVGSGAEGLECRAEEEPALLPCITSRRITVILPKLPDVSLQAIWSFSWERWGHLLKALFLGCRSILSAPPGRTLACHCSGARNG